MIRTVALAASIIANAVLVAAWVVTTPSAVTLESVVTAPAAIANDDDFGRWLALGLGEGEARRLLFATQEAAALAAIDNPWRRYWLAQDPSFAYAEELAHAYASLREDLERQFGATAENLPEFGRAFRPLDAQLGFLSSDQQLALQALRFREHGRNAVQPGNCRPPAPDQRTRPTVPISATLDFLPPNLAFEVLLRDSPRAAQLRRSGVDLSEPEFRRAFNLLERLDSNREVDVQLATRRELQGLLGGRRWAAIAAARDPLFAVLEQVASAHGLDAVKATAAYEVLGEIQDEWLELRASGRLNEPELVAAVAAREVERLSAVAGDTAAAAMLSAREQFYRQVRGNDARTPVAY